MLTAAIANKTCPVMTTVIVRLINLIIVIPAHISATFTHVTLCI
ncbi:Uncharacterised protein [Vibrio cholerae]|nr:Uncharacterised protein [Vibrio cholerae]